MRPIQLTICAFGSYGRKEIIDFTKTSQNLFLITGDTGSGKSTIFDAIVFALYGEVSSTNNKKNGVELQSQFVDCGVEPFVELIFIEDGEEYKVTRIPRHQRRLKNGKIAATISSEAVSLIMPDGTEYPAKETNQKLGELVGLTKDQFMQVAMIAQGEFMDVLRKESDKKKEIFRKLFNTEIFNSIVEVLGKRKKEKSTAMATIRTICQTEVGHILIPEVCDNQEVLSELKKRVFDEERLNGAVMEQLMQELDKLNREMQEKKSHMDEAFQQAERNYIQKNNEYVTADELKKRFIELEQAQAELVQYMALENEMKSTSSLIADIKLAYELKALADAMEEAETTYKSEEKVYTELSQKLPEYKKTYEEATAKLQEITKDKEACDAEYNKVSERVQKAVKQFEKIQELTVSILACEKDKVSFEESSKKIKADLEQLEKDEAQWRKSEEELKSAELTNSQLQNKKNNLTMLNQENAGVQAMMKELQLQKAAVSKAQDKYCKEKEAFELKNAEYETKQNQFLDAQAGILARKLVSGCACPVCGSLDHPNPCTVEESAKDLTQEIIDALANEVSSLRTKMENASANAKGLFDVLTEKETGVAAAFSKLSEHIQHLFDILVSVADNAYEENELACQNALSQIQASLLKEEQKNDADLKQLATIREKLAGVDKKKTALKEESAAAEQKAIEAVQMYASLDAELKTLQNAKDYASKEEAEQALDSISDKKKDVDLRYKECSEKNQHAGNELERCGAKMKQCEERMPGLKVKLDNAKQSYDNQLTKCNTTSQWWKAIVEANPKDTTVLEQRVSEFNTRKATSLAMKEKALEAIGDKSLPDMEILMQQLAEAREQKELRANEKTQLDHILNVNQMAHASLVSKMQERVKVLDEFDKLNNLYLTFSGNKTGAKMDIETYAQRYYLERILDAANVRFLDMSAGQFELRMINLDKAGVGRVNHGLDLMVYSNVTGMEREIRTLSGGESFMAALALALGMADIIQEKSSRISLDMMFIDEGFGSLDDHSRAEAVKVLKAMAGGSKLIGIISHVTELKQEIDDQLVVTKDDKGSRTQWVIS